MGKSGNRESGKRGIRSGGGERSGVGFREDGGRNLPRERSTVCGRDCRVAGAGCRAEEGGRDGDREIGGGGVGREVCGGGKGWRCSDLAAAAAAAA